MLVSLFIDFCLYLSIFLLFFFNLLSSTCYMIRKSLLLAFPWSLLPPSGLTVVVQ